MQGFLPALILSSTLLLSSCQTQGIDETGLGPHSEHLSFAGILSSKNPFELYQHAYEAFRFSSQTRLVLGKGASAEVLEGRTSLEWSPNGNFHLIRIPLGSKPFVELVYVGQRAYLRTQKDGVFRVVRYQKEFDRWIRRSVLEVITLLQDSGFVGTETFTEKDQKSCFENRANSLCLDPETGLPLFGSLRPQLQDLNPEFSFQFLPATEEPVAIIPPETPSDSDQP